MANIGTLTTTLDKNAISAATKVQRLLLHKFEQQRPIGTDIRALVTN